MTWAPCPHGVRTRGKKTFIAHKQLALNANPRFWQYGLLAFIARCCSFDNQHRHQDPGPAKVEEEKSQTTKEKDVDALTFMRTVLMSFVRGMEHGEQTLPTNDESTMGWHDIGNIRG